MARNIVETITDDLDGGANASSVSFSYDGSDYTIDLTDKNKKALEKLLKPYIDAGTKVSGARRSSGRRARASSVGKRSDLDAVRRWARDSGHQVSDRGRVSASVLEAYDAAH